MKSFEEKAEQINLLLSPKCVRKGEIKGVDFVKHLQSAVVVKHPEDLHKMIRKIIICSGPMNTSNKTFSIVKDSEGEWHPFIKSLNSAKRCHSSLSFRLAYLERLLLEDQINLREFKQFKAVLLKNRLAEIRSLAKNSSEKPTRINAKNLKTSKETFQHHINPYKQPKIF